MESSVRVAVANRPRLLRELVLSTLSGQAGIEVVGEAENEQDVPSLVAPGAAHVQELARQSSHGIPSCGNKSSGDAIGVNQCPTALLLTRTSSGVTTCWACEWMQCR